MPSDPAPVQQHRHDHHYSGRVPNGTEASTLLPLPPRGYLPRSRWSVIGPYLVGILGVGLAVAVAVVFLSFRAGVETQLTNYRNALNSLSQQDQTNYAGLTNRVDGFETGLNAVLPLARFKQGCTTAITGPNGALEAGFPCVTKNGS
jgi:hypothetical protein